MLYATVRNRKISVKKPTVLPCRGQNVDFLTLDLDEQWDNIPFIVCTFTNDYQQTKKQRKTTKTTTIVETITTKADGENAPPVVAKTETTDVEVTYSDVSEGDPEKSGTETTTETDIEEIAADDNNNEPAKTRTTVTTVKMEYKEVETAEDAKVKRDAVPEDRVVKIPHECIQHEGQLSVCLTGYSAKVDDAEDINENTGVLTMALPDSFWELVENGAPEWEYGEVETAQLYEQALAVVGEASAAADNAADIANALSQKAAAGGFDGKDGTTPLVSIASVETAEQGAAAQVWNSGTAADVRLNFRLPRGEKGDKGADGKEGFSPYITFAEMPELNGTDVTIHNENGPIGFTVYNGKDGTNGADGKTPQKGVDYFTEEDKRELVGELILAFPDGDVEAY